MGSGGKPYQFKRNQPSITMKQNYRNVDKIYIFPNTLNLDQVIAHIYEILTFMFT